MVVHGNCTVISRRQSIMQDCPKTSSNVKIGIFHLCLSKSMPRNISPAAHVVVFFIAKSDMSHMAISSHGNQMIICSVGRQTRHFHDSTATISTSRKAQTQQPRLTMRLQFRCPIFIFVRGSTCKSNVGFAHCASSALSFVATASRFLFSPVACSTKFQVTNAASKQRRMIYSIYKSKLVTSSKHRLKFFLKSTFLYVCSCYKIVLHRKMRDAEMS